MSDTTENGQRTPLSSSASHASGTSALSVKIGPDTQAENKAAISGENPSEDSQPSDAADAGAAEAQDADADFTAPEPAAPETDSAEPAAAPPEADAAQPQFTQYAEPEMSAGPTGSNDNTAEISAATLPEAAPDFDGEPVASNENPMMETASEAAVETAEAASEIADAGAQALADTAETAGEIASAGAQQAEFVAETVADAATDGLAAMEEALPGGAEEAEQPETPAESPPQQLTHELRAAIRDNTVKNEARQDQALTLFQEVTRNFATALEEAGQDATRMTLNLMKFAQANLQNNFELARESASAKNVPEFFDAQATYLKRQFELLQVQAAELRELTNDLTTKGAAQLRKHAPGLKEPPRPRMD
jgi:hypothetical protein